MTKETAADGRPWPRIIQGGMGIAVSNWRLARAVAEHGEMGVVSGTALDTVLIRRLQDGDPGGDMRRALAALPIPGLAATVLKRWFQPKGGPGRSLPAQAYAPRSGCGREDVELLIAAGFVESSWPRRATTVGSESICWKRSS